MVHVRIEFCRKARSSSFHLLAVKSLAGWIFNSFHVLCMTIRCVLFPLLQRLEEST
jgi:hypothetical protein